MLLLGLRIGQGFEVPLLKARGVVVDANPGAVTVRVVKGDQPVRVEQWAPFTEVVPAQVEVPESGAATDIELTCECGKTCTSKSGLTLHRKGCQAALVQK